MKFKYFVCTDESLEDRFGAWDGDQGDFITYEPGYRELRDGLLYCIQHDNWLMKDVDEKVRGELAKRLASLLVDIDSLEQAAEYYEQELTEYFKPDALGELPN